MNISKYCEFILDSKVSKKTNKTYYCITLRIKDSEFPLLFISEKKYNEMKNTLQ